MSVVAPNVPLGTVLPVSKEGISTADYKNDSIHPPPIQSADSVASSPMTASDGKVPQHRITLSTTIIPSGDSVVFRDSSFFARNLQPLPSPAEVYQKAEQRNPANPRSQLNPRPVHYPRLGLTVKYGARVVIAEGQCLWAIRHLLGNTVPVPEVYGWTTDQGVVFIYMEHIRGETLESQWDQLSEPERLDICGQLRSMVCRIKSLEQVPGDCFVGKEHGNPHLNSRLTTPFRKHHSRTFV